MANKGKPRNIDSPEELYDLFEKYSIDYKKDYLEFHPVTKEEFKNYNYNPN